MARFGQGMIQALTQPSYMQGLYEAAKGVGEMPRVRREEAAKKDYLNELAAIQDPLARLQRQAQHYQSQGDVAAVEQTMLNIDALKKDLEKERETELAGRGSGELISLATSEDFNFRDPQQLRGFLGIADAYGISRGDAMRIAIQGQSTPAEVNTQLTTIVGEDGKEERVLIRTDSQGNLVGQPESIGAVYREPKDTPFTLNISPNATEEQLWNAHAEAISANEPATANAIRATIEDRFPAGPNPTETLALAKAIDPEAERWNALRNNVAETKALIGSTAVGAQALLDKQLARLFEDNIRALQEIDRFVQSADIVRRVQDGVNKFFTGKTTEITRQEQQALVEALAEVAASKQRNILDRLYAEDEDIAEQYGRLMGLSNESVSILGSATD